jgi:hypothetical protein
MLFCDESTFVRFLFAAKFDQELATKNFKYFVEWRRVKHVNMIQENEEICETKVKNALPNTWHYHDDAGRPCWYF